MDRRLGLNLRTRTLGALGIAALLISFFVGADEFRVGRNAMVWLVGRKYYHLSAIWRRGTSALRWSLAA